MADLWVQSFEGDPDDAARELQAAFGLDEATARGIVDNTPCVVKRNVGPVEAMPWVRVLREMGARVELRDEAVRQDPRASLRMPRARFGRKSLRPSDKGTKRPDVPSTASIPNPAGEDPSPEPSPPGSEVLDEVLGDVLAEVAKPKAVPARPVAVDGGTGREAVPSPFPASALVTPVQSSATTPGPAVFGPPEGTTPRRVSGAASKGAEEPSVRPQAPALEPPPNAAQDGYGFGEDSSDDEGDLGLDLSGDLDLAPEEPTPPPVPSVPEPPPNAAQDGYGFGEDPLEPPIPEGMLELDVVEPSAAEPAPMPMPEDAPRSPDAAADPFEDEPPNEDVRRSGRRRQLRWAAMLLAGGAVLLGVSAVAGLSCFAGSVPLPLLILDAAGFTGLALGGVLGLGALGGREVELSPGHALGALVLMFGLAAGLDFLNAPTPEELRAIEAMERDEETEEAIAESRYPEARSWAQARGASPAVARLIDELYTSGARQVYASGSRELIVAMPELQAARESIERTYRRFLGYRRNRVDASLHPATRYWWIVVEFGD